MGEELTTGGFSDDDGEYNSCTRGSGSMSTDTVSVTSVETFKTIMLSTEGILQTLVSCLCGCSNMVRTRWYSVIVVPVTTGRQSLRVSIIPFE